MSKNDQETEYEPTLRLEIGTNDEEQVVITVEKRIDGEWWGLDTVYGRSLTEAMNNARKLIVDHTS
jgi:hypothetical protein